MLCPTTTINLYSMTLGLNILQFISYFELFDVGNLRKPPWKCGLNLVYFREVEFRHWLTAEWVGSSCRRGALWWMRKTKGFQLTFGSSLPSCTQLICCFCHICKSQSRSFSVPAKDFFTIQEFWHELWFDTLRLETTLKHKGQVKTVIMTNTHWGAFSTFVNPFKVQGGCSVLSLDIWPPYNWGGGSGWWGSCSTLPHQSKWYCKDQ